MNVVDANVLVYAVNASDPRHEQARAWLDAALTGSETVGFTWIVILAFVRLVTKVGLFPDPMTVGEATTIVREWLAQPTAVLVEPTSRHLDVLAGLLAHTGTGGNLVSDAHVAAIAAEHDATVVTYDTDFARFGVRMRPPA